MASEFEIKGDKIRIHKTGGSAELIIENATKAVSGFLSNQGNGVTIFKPVIKAISTTDDLDLYKHSDADYIATQSNNSIYEWQASGIPNGTTIFDADDSGVWVLVIGVGGTGGAPYFEKTLETGFNVLVAKAEHGITNVRGVTLLTSDRQVVDAYVEILANDNVYIESNINLIDFILKIY